MAYCQGPKCRRSIVFDGENYPLWWLISPRIEPDYCDNVVRPGQWIVRCPEHVTERALRQTIFRRTNAGIKHYVIEAKEHLYDDQPGMMFTGEDLIRRFLIEMEDRGLE